jgi:hypothetical protein
MKYIVALDGSRLATYHRITNQKWEETIKQSMKRSCDRKEAQGGVLIYHFLQAMNE